MADRAIAVTVVRAHDIDKLIGAPLRRYMETCVLLAHGDVAQAGRAPIDKGYLRASLAAGAGVTGVDPADPPKWAQVGTNVTNGGTSYPSILEESDRHNYAGGPSAGQPTRGWLSQTVQNVAGDVKQAQERMMKDIQNGWGK